MTLTFNARIIGKDYPTYSRLENIILKSGRLPKPIKAYMGIGPNSLGAIESDLIQSIAREAIYKFNGIIVLTRDPALALSPGVNTLLEMEAYTGLPIPNDNMEVVQLTPAYRVLSRDVSPPDENGNCLELFKLQEVVFEHY